MTKEQHAPGMRPDVEHEKIHVDGHAQGHDQDHHHSEIHQQGHEQHAHHHEHHHDAAPEQGTVLTVRAASGLSGDMMLAGLAALAGLQNDGLHTLVEELRLPSLRGCLTLEPRRVNAISGVGCRVELPVEHAHRNLADIRKIISESAMPDDAKQLSARAFTILAEAEAAVHGKATDEVNFHEVGALDSILDTCLVCRIVTLLAPGRFICGPLPVADGVIRCAHGLVPSPAPAALRLLENVPVCGFSGTGETVTPTALALLKALGAEFGIWPAMQVHQTVMSYGSKVFAHAPNGALWAWGLSI